MFTYDKVQFYFVEMREKNFYSHEALFAAFEMWFGNWFQKLFIGFGLATF